MKRREEKTDWRAYTDLAWTEPIITAPEDYVEEAEIFVRAIKESSRVRVGTLLHLGCGAGVYDYAFKKHFQVTGVDISREMLALAKKLNPEVEYIRGDMREVNLGRKFDAVAIPDSICHMATVDELRKTFAAASGHLKPGGALLVVTYVSEDYRDNNFVYTGAKGDVEVTIFENNYIVRPGRRSCETTVVYLIRRKGKLEIHHDSFTAGLFPLKTWLGLFREAGFKVEQRKLKHLYDRFVMEKGEYVLRMFVGTGEEGS